LIAACGIDKTSRVCAPWEVILARQAWRFLATRETCCRAGAGSRDSMQMSVERMARSKLSPFYFIFKLTESDELNFCFAQY
jgi:hypothetical protein